jgi:hypothetical protein
MPATPKGLLVRSTHFNGHAETLGAFPPRLAEKTVREQASVVFWRRGAPNDRKAADYDY